MANGDLVFVPDHKTRARAVLLSQYQGKPNIEALVEALALGAQMLEDQTFDVLISTTLTSASGHALDQWGALVGEVRGDLDDEDYRRFISARIKVNNSEGTTDELIEIWSLLVEPYIEIRHQNYQPATFELMVLRDSYMSDARARRVGQTMRAVKPAGIAMELVESIPGAFGFVEAAGDPWFRQPLDIGLLARTI